MKDCYYNKMNNLILLAGIGSGIFRDIEDACNRCCRAKNSFIPDKKNHQTYADTFNNFKLLSDHLNGFWTAGQQLETL
jgi:sugar (pentulose or hexulose) kinase